MDRELSWPSFAWYPWIPLGSRCLLAGRSREQERWHPDTQRLSQPGSIHLRDSSHTKRNRADLWVSTIALNHPPNLPMRRMPEGVVGADSPKYNRSPLSGDVIYVCPRIRSEFDLILEYWLVDRWGE